MKSTAAAAFLAFAVAARAAVVARGTASSQLCAGSSFEESGNWYCRPVHRITYQNVGTSGVYNEVVSMDQQTGNCEFRPKQFSGPLAPFNEPVSLTPTRRRVGSRSLTNERTRCLCISEAPSS